MNSKKGTKEKNGSGRYTEVICDEGLVYKQKHDLAMAMQCYNTALKIDPYLGPAYNLRADIYNSNFAVVKRSINS